MSTYGHKIMFTIAYNRCMEVTFMRYDHRVTGEVIRQLRKKRKLSQEVFSGLAGLERTHLTKIELGEKSASPETLDKIAEAFDMRLSELIRLAEDEVERQNQ